MPANVNFDMHSSYNDDIMMSLFTKDCCRTSTILAKSGASFIIHKY